MSNESGKTDCFWCGAVYIEDGHDHCPSCATPTGAITIVSGETDSNTQRPDGTPF